MIRKNRRRKKKKAYSFLRKFTNWILKGIVKIYHHYQKNIGGKNSGKEVVIEKNVKLLFIPIAHVAKANRNIKEEDRIKQQVNKKY